MDGYIALTETVSEGIDLSLVTVESKNLVEELICPICNNLSYEPVICKENQCLYCKKCITTWVEKKGQNAACPNCKKIFIFDQIPRLIKNLINKVKLNCIYMKKGCIDQILYEQFVNHVNNCDYQNFQCKKPQTVDL